jgi:hypothetical protein
MPAISLRSRPKTHVSWPCMRGENWLSLSTLRHTMSDGECSGLYRRAIQQRRNILSCAAHLCLSLTCCSPQQSSRASRTATNYSWMSEGRMLGAFCNGDDLGLFSVIGRRLQSSNCCSILKPAFERNRVSESPSRESYSSPTDFGPAPGWTGQRVSNETVSTTTFFTSRAIRTLTPVGYLHRIIRLPCHPCSKRRLRVSDELLIPA